MRISVRADVNAARRRLNDVQLRQIPFATASALSGTAFELRKHVIAETYPRSFTVRNKSFARALFRVQKATKATLTAVVYQVLDRRYMQGHTKGVTRTARQGKLAVPVTANVQKGARGVPKSKRPRALPNSFKRTLKSGDEGIFQRYRDGRIKLMYVLKQSVPNPKRFRFYEDAVRLVRRVFPREFDKSLRRALATAR